MRDRQALMRVEWDCLADECLETLRDFALPGG
jgi:hypothetical protein